MWKNFGVGINWRIWQIEHHSHIFYPPITSFVISYSYTCSSFANILPLQNFTTYSIKESLLICQLLATVWIYPATSCCWVQRWSNLVEFYLLKVPQFLIACARDNVAIMKESTKPMKPLANTCNVFIMSCSIRLCITERI